VSVKSVFVHEFMCVFMCAFLFYLNNFFTVKIYLLEKIFLLKMI